VKILKLLGATTMLYGGQKQKEKTFEYWSHEKLLRKGTRQENIDSSNDSSPNVILRNVGLPNVISPTISVCLIIKTPNVGVSPSLNMVKLEAAIIGGKHAPQGLEGGNMHWLG